MKSHARRLIAAAMVLIIAGIARMPVEQALTKDLQNQGLLAEPLDIETRKKVGQGFWAVSLGGLRSLVATVLNLRAFAFFENQKWTQLAETYDTVVNLAPDSDYYWDTGSWHMAYNAAAYYQTSSDLPELRRRAEWKRWIEKGTAFLEEGTRQNPDSWYLWSRLGWLYADPNKLIDYEKAATAYMKAIEAGNELPFVRNGAAYALARVPEREDEAFELVKKLRESPRGRVPTMNCLHFALETKRSESVDPDQLLREIFGDEEDAYSQLSGYFLAQKNFPMDGVAPALRKLETRLDVPAENSIFRQREALDEFPTNPWQR